MGFTHSNKRRETIKSLAYNFIAEAFDEDTPQFKEAKEKVLKLMEDPEYLKDIIVLAYLGITTNENGK